MRLSDNTGGNSTGEKANSYAYFYNLGNSSKHSFMTFQSIVGKENNSPDIIKKVNEIVYAPLKENNGSISAEHGIGLDKKNYLIKSRSKPEIELMKQIKHLFDSKNILNPGRII